jgi:type II secretory pathway component PulC
VSRVALGLGLWLALAACGGGRGRPAYAVGDELDDPAAGRLLGEEERAVTRRPPAIPDGTDVLTRAALGETLAAGPGAFLGRIRVRAVGEKGVFRGWVILALWPGARTELQPGDVVRRLNGRILERPEDVTALWEALRVAPEIVVDYERGGQPRVYRVPIVE